MSRRLTTAEFVEKASSVHNGKYDYSQTVYITSRDKLSIICPKHGVFEQRAADHLSGNGCPMCMREWSEEHKQNLRESSRRSRGMTTAEWVERVKKVHGEKYDYSQTVYVNQRTNVKIICPKHGLFEQKADSHLRGCGCQLCGRESENYKGVHNWSDKQRRAIEETCLQRYGARRYLDSVEGRARFEQIRSTPEFRMKMREIISSDVVQEKSRATCKLKYGVAFPMQLPEVIDKVGEAKSKNKTLAYITARRKYVSLFVYKIW